MKTLQLWTRVGPGDGFRVEETLLTPHGTADETEKKYISLNSG